MRLVDDPRIGMVEQRMPRHVMTMIGVVGALFVLLWFGVVVLELTAGRAMGASVLTLVLFGAGAMYTASTLRTDDGDRE
jgi:hypothetical protein